MIFEIEINYLKFVENIKTNKLLKWETIRFHHNIHYPIKIIDYDIMTWKESIKLIITLSVNYGRSRTNAEIQFFWVDLSIWQFTGNPLRQSLHKGLINNWNSSWCLLWVPHEPSLSNVIRCGDKHPLNKQQLGLRLGEVSRHTPPLSFSEGAPLLYNTRISYINIYIKEKNGT